MEQVIDLLVVIIFGFGPFILAGYALDKISALEERIQELERKNEE